MFSLHFLVRSSLCSYLLYSNYNTANRALRAINIFSLVLVLVLFNYYESIPSLSDTVLVTAFFLNVFFRNYERQDSTLYEKIIIVLSLLNTACLLTYFFVMAYDVALDLSLDVNSSPVQWIVNFIEKIIVSSSNCSPGPIDNALSTWERFNDA